MKNFKIAGIFLLFIGFYLAGCRAKSQQSSDGDTTVQHTKKLTLDSVQKIVAQTSQKYKAMDNATLLKNLSDQSKRKKEPFNSPAYRELKTRTDVNADSLKSLVLASKNGDALLPLLLVRQLNKKVYQDIPVETRAAVLTDALQQSVTFNTWGLPNLYLEDASRAMIECGASAAPALKRMLAETRPAPVFGSQQSMESLRYHYRLCDYALFFLEQIQGNTKVILPVTVAGRDSLIKKLR